MKRNTTIKDIAKALGISTSTVSRALSNRWDVSSETRNAVTSMAEKMHYRPNPIAISLLRNRSLTIGLVVPEFINSFFPNVIIGIQRVIEEAGYQLLITQCSELAEVEAKNIKLLCYNRVEGIILSSVSETCNLDLYKETIESGTPIIFFNRAPEKIDANKVVVDDYKMAFFAVEHLIYQGYKQIYHFAGPHDLSLTINRSKGYRDAMRKHTLEASDSTIIPVGLFEEDGYNAMKTLIAVGDLPEAIFCFCDPLALGALRAMREHGLSTPDDVALVGFSESRSGVLMGITSVAQPLCEMGETTARLMIEEIEQMEAGKTVTHQTVTLQSKISIRTSSTKK